MNYLIRKRFVQALVMAGMGSIAASAYGAETWWDYSYDAQALPSDAQPAWEMVAPTVRSGMTIDNAVQPGGLVMKYKGTSASDYYEITYSHPQPTPTDPSPAQVWNPTTATGATVEIRLKILEAVPGVPWSLMLAAGGLGAAQNQPAIILFASNQVSFLGTVLPVDLTDFRTVRLVYDSANKKADLYLDGKLISSLPYTAVPIDTNLGPRLIFGSTFAGLVQGSAQIAYIRWSNHGPIQPTSGAPSSTGTSNDAPRTPSSTATMAAATAPNLKDPVIARAHDLLEAWPRFPQVAVPYTDHPPQIDGTVDPREWQGATRLSGMVALSNHEISATSTLYFLEHDDSDFYLGFQFHRANSSEIRAQTTSRVTSLWNKEDGVEIVLSPDDKKHSIFSLYLNGASGYSEGSKIDKSDLQTSWQSGSEIKTRVTADGMEGEIRIPMTAFSQSFKDAGLTLDKKTWGFDAMRVDLAPVREEFSWSDMWDAANDYAPSALGQLHFEPDRIAVRLNSPAADLPCLIGGEILNGGDKVLHARLQYVIYKANRDVVKEQIGLYPIWDKINRIHLTGSDVDKDAAFQLFLGEDNWLKSLGEAYDKLQEKSVDLSVAPGASGSFGFSLDARGQYIYGARLTDRDTGAILWGQTAPYDLEGGISIDIANRFLTAKGINVTINTAGNTKIKPGDFLDLKVLDAKQTVVKSAELTVLPASTLIEKFVPMDDCPVGPYTVQVLVSLDGKKVAASDRQFSKPPLPSWLGNRIGYSDQVPSPFTAVKATATQSSIWGRNYQWNGRDPFPISITTQGHDLLSAPIQLVGTSGGQPIKWTTTEWKLLRSEPREAAYHSIQESGNLKLDLTVTVDFDGLIRFKGSVAGQNSDIEQLLLTIPLKNEMVTHFHASQFHTEVKLVKDMKGDNSKYRAGYIGDFTKAFPDGATPFAALFWLGGNDGGLQWISEWDKGWVNADREKVMKVVRDDKSTSLQVSFIGMKTVLQEPLPIDFAVNVSPVKDPAYFWDIATCLGPSNAIRPEDYEPNQLKSDLTLAKANGITTVMTGGYGFPFFADVWVRDRNRPHFKEIVDQIHQAGLKTYYYGCWAYINNGAESPAYGADMMKIPVEPGGPDTYWYDPEGPFVDFFMAGLDKTVKDFGIDGIYLDGMPVTSLCADPLMGQTYVDEKGEVHGRWPIFALREWTMRMQNYMHINPLHTGIVYEHDSSVPNLAVESLADIRIVGEDIPSTDSLRQSVSLDSYFARASIHAFGIPCESIWYNWWERPLKENQLQTAFLLTGQLKDRYGACYLPSTPKDYALDSLADIPLLHLFHGFGIPTARWVPYDSAQNWVKTNPPSLYASSYVHPGEKAMVIVGNMDKKPAPAAEITLSLSDIGLKSGDISVHDAILNTDIPLDGNKIHLDVDGERFRALLITKKS
jgi:hypothetical protein